MQQYMEYRLFIYHNINDQQYLYSIIRICSGLDRTCFSKAPKKESKVDDDEFCANPDQSPNVEEFRLLRQMAAELSGSNLSISTR